MLANSRPTRLVPAPAGSIELLGRSQAAARLQELVRRAATLSTGVLIVAERGVDAESIARAVHARSRQAGTPLVLVDCAAEPAGAFDPLLFGAAPIDAPTDLEPVASASRVAAARGGTLVLRDVGELPAAVQARLARIARDGEMRVDGAIAPAAFRIIATATPAIDADVREHRFRGDLYRRLTASRIDVPSLRDRAEDVPAMAARVLEEACAAAGSAPRAFTQAALALLSALSWPGNLAELSSVIERVAGSVPQGALQIEHVLPALQLQRNASAVVPAGSLREARQRFERDYIAAVLQQHGWRVADAAQTLGIQRPNLYRKARQLGIPVTRLPEEQ
jgi:two-component system nitrogen regulation response regulator NtrX